MQILSKVSLKNFIMGVLGAVVLCLGLGSKAVHAQTVSPDEALINQYYQAVNDRDWEAWLALFGDEYAASRSCILNDPYNQENNRGIYVVDRVLEVTDIQEVADKEGYGGVIRECEGEDIELYLAITDMEIDRENGYYFNGANYNIMLIGTVDGERKIVGVSLPLVETVMEYDEEAAMAYGRQRFGSEITPYSAACEYTTIPSIIKVCRWKYGDGQTEDVDFNEYVKIVTAAEFGYVNRDADYHYAGALAVKMYAWYKKIHADPSNGYDVTDTNEKDDDHPLKYQIYNPDKYGNVSTWKKLFDRVDEVWSCNFYSSNYNMMDIQYRAKEGEKNSGIMNADVANQMANNGDSYQTILNSYYGNSPLSTGNITFVTAGEHAYYLIRYLDYFTRYVCKCGHIEIVYN